MPLTLFQQDTFTRANQSGWGTASNGSTWTTFVGSPTLSIASNEGKATGVNATDLALYLSTSTVADTEVVVRLTNSDFANDATGVYLRVADSSNFYRCFIGSGAINIDKKVAGTFTGAIATAAITLTSSTYYWIRFHAQGTTLSARYWLDGNTEPGTYNITVTDSSISAAGKVGVGSYQNATANTVQFDNFSAYTITTTTNQPTTGTNTTGVKDALTAAIVASPANTTAVVDVLASAVSVSLRNTTAVVDLLNAVDIQPTTGTNTTAVVDVLKTVSIQLPSGTNTTGVIDTVFAAITAIPSNTTAVGDLLAGSIAASTINTTAVVDRAQTLIAASTSSSNPNAQMTEDDAEIEYQFLQMAVLTTTLARVFFVRYPPARVLSAHAIPTDLYVLLQGETYSQIHQLSTINQVTAFITAHS